MGVPFQITFDCEDAVRMCRFWSTALGYVEEPPPHGFDSWKDFLSANDVELPPPGSVGALVDPDGVGPRLLFLRVPERKTVKNRIHFDLRAGRTDAEKQSMIDRLTLAGATTIRRVDEHGQWWTVMADPEGNEFCVT